VHSRVSVVSPVYRAEGCLRELHRRLMLVLEEQALPYEIILVDDGSPDTCGEIIEQLAVEHEHTVAISLSRNFGQHAAILAGLAEATGDVLVVMDCDLQDRPEDIPHLLEKIEEGFDVVIVRRRNRTTSWLKRFASRLWFTTLNRLSANRYEPDASNFSAIRRSVADALLRMPNRNQYYLLLLLWLGFRRTYVELDDGGRFSGPSSYSFARLIRHAVVGLTSHSTRLLHFSTYMGFVFVLLALLQFAYVLYLKFSSGVGVAGWPSLMATLWLIGGAILFSLGVIGLYLATVIDDLKQRPPYVVRSRTRRGEQ
jgi:glycosyltransferase involved in cell wall biosynthesis